jgi:ATP-dependent helicase IRC3
VGRLFRNARWRFEPASPSQIAFLSKKRQGTPAKGEKGWDPNTLTKGEAANLITRFKNGIQAYYEKKLAQQEKAAKAAAKEQLRINSQLVKVGPLHGGRSAGGPLLL